MVNNWLGAEKFRKGLALYLKRHQYKNTVTEDLWAALEETSQQPVNKVSQQNINLCGMLVCGHPSYKERMY